MEGGRRGKQSCQASRMLCEHVYQSFMRRVCLAELNELFFNQQELEEVCWSQMIHVYDSRPTVLEIHSMDAPSRLDKSAESWNLGFAPFG